MTHDLKTWKEYFEPIVSGHKTFEVRKNDRGFAEGDILTLIETDFGGAGMTDHDLTRVATGRRLDVMVRYILSGGSFGIEKDHCVMAIDKISAVYLSTNNQTN